MGLRMRYAPFPWGLWHVTHSTSTAGPAYAVALSGPLPQATPSAAAITPPTFGRWAEVTGWEPAVRTGTLASSRTAPELRYAKRKASPEPIRAVTKPPLRRYPSVVPVRTGSVPSTYWMPFSTSVVAPRPDAPWHEVHVAIPPLSLSRYSPCAVWAR